MSKKYLVLGLIATMVLTANTAFASFNDGLGRTHFFGNGGYSPMTNMQYGEAESNMINNYDFTTESKKNNRNIIFKDNDDATIPASSRQTYNYKSKNYDDDYLEGSSVNDSKSIYTDTLGRLHFFGKDSKIKK